MLTSSSAGSDDNDKNQPFDAGMSSNLLREEIEDALEDNSDIDITDDIIDLESKIFKALEINNRLSRQRVQNIIFQLQKEKGVMNQRMNQLSLLLSRDNLLRIAEKDNIHDELKNDPSESCEIQIVSPPPSFKDIKNTYMNEMKPLIKNYTKQKYKNECCFENCGDVNIKANGNDIYQCPCIKRLSVFLKIYQEFFEEIASSKMNSNVCYAVR